MTTSWRPAEREIDPLREFALEAIRVAVFGVPPVGLSFETVPGTPFRQALLSDGRVARASVSFGPAEQRQRGPRTCIGLRATGEVATASEGYRLAAEIVVDQETGAMLACDLDLHSVGVPRRQ